MRVICICNGMDSGRWSRTMRWNRCLCIEMQRAAYIVSGIDNGTSRNKGLCNGMDVYTLSAICELQIYTDKDRIENEKWRNTPWYLHNQYESPNTSYQEIMTCILVVGHIEDYTSSNAATSSFLNTTCLSFPPRRPRYQLRSRPSNSRAENPFPK